MGFFEWAAELSKTSPFLSGALVPVYMLVLGTAFALIADLIVKLSGIQLGEYKKEYDDEESAKVH